MACARNIKPALFRNEVLGVADPLYRYFPILVASFDREGRLEDRPIHQSRHFPIPNGLNVDAMLSWLHDNGFIIRYQSRENRYIQIVNFAKHQNPHKTGLFPKSLHFSNGCTDFRKSVRLPKIGTAPADSRQPDS